MNDYEYHFKTQALREFEIDVNDYVIEIDLDYLLSDTGELYHLCLHWIKLQDWTKAIEKLMDYKNKILTMCLVPESLTIDDRQKMRDIRRYLQENKGILNGYFYYRQKYTNNIIKQFQEITLANRMIILANKDLIISHIDKLIHTYTIKQDNAQKIKEQVRKKDISDWHKKCIMCVCGLEIQQVNKKRHEKSIQHNTWVKEHQPNTEIKENTYKWYLEKYKCMCGKTISNGNRATHEKTKYHNLFV